MEQKYNTSSIKLEFAKLREFCKREGEALTFNKGELLERQGEPAKWIAYVESGCFKYVKQGISDDKTIIEEIDKQQEENEASDDDIDSIFD